MNEMNAGIEKKEYDIQSEQDLAQIAKDVLELAVEFKKTNSGAALIALQGDLGAGKTTFTKYLAKELGISEHLMSPTFVILKRYPIAEENPFSKTFSELIHIDAYRLSGGVELSKLGFDQILMDTSSLICLEWPELVADILPRSYLKVNFEHIFEHQEGKGRKVTVEVKV